MPALDIERVLSTLDRHGVDYVLIGGLAARLHGSPLLTEDVDITPSTEPENLGRLADAVTEMDAHLRVVGAPAEGVPFEFDERCFGLFTSMTLVTKFGFVDLCFRPDGTSGYPDLSAGAETYEVYGLKIRVASLDDVIRSKTAAGRERDLQALPTLQALKERRGRGS